MNLIKRGWLKIKRWVYALLIALGIIIPAMAALKDFTYTPATFYEDGTPLPIEQIAETRLYCNGELVASEAGADGDFTNVLLAPGDYDCYGTHVATNGLESGPSGSVVFTVLPEVAPNPPESLGVN